MSNHYDVVVIGAGSGGLSSAVGLAKVGKKVLLVEKEHMGGECTNSGCIPSKALLHYAKQYYWSVGIAGRTEQSETYRRQAFNYVREKIAEILADETPEHFTKMGITVLSGEAEFVGKKSLKVNEIEYSFTKAIIATGSSPRPLTVPGLAENQILTNQNFFAQESIPERTLIVGAGPIGLELGQALAMLGSQVTIATIDNEFARLEDEAIRPILRESFAKLGVTIQLDSHIERVENNVAVFARKNGDVVTDHFEVPFDKILIAIGRVPNIPKGLDLAEVEAEAFGIKVNSNWRTTNKNIYALGDVSARMKFTHVADDTARQVVTHIMSKSLLSVSDNKAIPKVTYTEPEIAQVGLSWDEAKTEFGEEKIMRIEVPFAANDRARTDDATAGILVVIAKRLTGKVLGAHIIGPRAGELITVFTLAIDQKISLYKLRSTIFAYPTYSLIIKKAGDYFLAQQVASLKPDLLMAAKSWLPKIVAISLWLIVLYQVFSYQQTYGLTVSELTLKLFKAITATAWGPLLYILVYTVRPLTFFPGTALTILSGVFFGLWGILYTIIGANLSAALAYFVGRYFTSENNAARRNLDSWTDKVKTEPFLSVLIMRLIFVPFDLLNYGSGILRIPFMPYIIATFLGTLLGITTFVSIGASLGVEEFIRTGLTAEAIDGKFILFSIFIFLVSVGVSKLIKPKIASK